MIQVKKILNDIVEVAYAGNPKLEQYKRFYVEISKKNLKSKHGHYIASQHKIVIFNTYRDDEAIICTTIHELAHHVDYINRGHTDHQGPFYKVYAELIYSALDMGVISETKFRETEKDASDSNKIRKIMDDYHSKEIGYKVGQYIISVQGGYEVKETLKATGYRFNGNGKSWDKEVAGQELEEQIKSLDELGVDYLVRDARKMAFTSTLSLIAVKGNTYALRDELYADGFYWKKTGKKKGNWELKVDSHEQAEMVIEKYPAIEFQLK